MTSGEPHRESDGWFSASDPMELPVLLEELLIASKAGDAEAAWMHMLLLGAMH